MRTVRTMTGSPPVPASSGLLDDVNRAIVRQLHEDGRRTYGSIAEAVGLSEAAVRQRVQKMREAGILQIVAVTDPQRIGLRTRAMVGIRTVGDARAVADRLAQVEDIHFVVLVAGAYDILVELVCEDEDRMLELVNGVVRATAGVSATETIPYLATTKQTYTWGSR